MIVKQNLLFSDKNGSTIVVRGYVNCTEAPMFVLQLILLLPVFHLSIQLQIDA